MRLAWPVGRAPCEAKCATVAHFTIAAGVIIAALPALADPLTCSTWNGIRTCSSPGGYTWTEWQWQGLVTGQDGAGDRW
jgi:hypothetical protein